MELPISVMVPVTPFVDGREVDLGLVLPTPFALDLERGELRALEERLEPDDARGLRVGARLAELGLRADELRLLRVEPPELALRRVLVWAMMTHLPQVPALPVQQHPALGMKRYTPAWRV
jgi:hypothetical protein